MLTFWFLTSTLVVISLAFVLPPLFGRSSGSEVTRDDINIAIFHQRMLELDNQVKSGELTVDASEQAELEWRRTLLRDVGTEETDVDPSAARRLPVVATLVAVAVPLLASGLYLAYGTPSAMLVSGPTVDQRVTQNAVTAPVAEQELPSVGDMVARLESRLQANPDDAEGWLMLGRSFATLEQLDKARTALARADAIRPDHASTLLTLAEVIAAINGDKLAGEPVALITRAVNLEPELPRALWLAGFAALTEGNKEEAVNYWQRLSSSTSLSAEQTQRLQGLIAFAKGEVDTAAQSSTSAAAPKPAPEQTIAASSVALRVFVSVADELLGKVKAHATVFVFARAVNGPPMPLAAARLTASDLPAEVVLDDSMAMMPAHRLSAYPEVVVGARISTSGGPIASSGDFQGISDTVSVAKTESVAVVIDSVVP